MPSVASESSQDNRPVRLARSGTLVLSSSCHVLFADRRAVDLMGLLDADVSDPPLTQTLPACLVNFAKEIDATDSMRKDSRRSWLGPVARIAGSPSRLVRVQGFRLAHRDREDRWIVLILSRLDQEAVP